MSDKASESRAIAVARELRRKRARRLAIGLAIWVGLPTLVAAIYYAAIASPEFESVAVVMVESSDPGAGEAEPTSSFLPHAGSSRDVQVAREYARSRAMLELLAAKHGLVAHYQSDEVDRWSRLAGDAGREEAFAYFQDKVAVSGDDAGTMTLRVRAFGAAEAQAFARAILEHAERMMNEQSSRARQDQLALGEAAVKQAKARLVELGAQLAAAQGATPPAAAAELEALALEKELARRELESALGGLEQARAAAARERRYLVTVAEPSLPDAPSYPRTGWRIATVAVVSLALAGVLSLLVAAAREHAKL